MLVNEFTFEPWFFVLLILLVASAYFFFNGKPQGEIEIYYDNSCNITSSILSKCHCLKEGYDPSVLWGRNGHIQSLLFTVLGRFGTVLKQSNQRHELIAKDGSIVTYDVFNTDEKEKGFILVIPGICNTAENTYVKVFARYMTSLGYKVAVFNHTGALKNVKLRKAKIFTYGQTDDLDFVVSTLMKREKISQFSAAIGFSLGANILMKYLGEDKERQNYFKCATSICQGYDIPECNIYFRQWDNLRCVYNYCLTRNMLKVINRHKEVLDEHLDVNWNRISSVKSLSQLDEAFTIKITDEDSIDEFYVKSSSSQYMKNINIPLLIMNAKDDPLIPEALFRYPKNLIDTNPNVLFVVTTYGGHMGYFEGGIVFPNQLSWLDRLLGQFVQASATKAS